MKKIALAGEKGSGLFALVDDEDYYYVLRYSWSLMKKGFLNYVNTKMNTPTGRRTVLLHHYILRIEVDRFCANQKKELNGMVIDHIDHNGLNCQKNNLRLCTVQQNVFNSRKQSTQKTSRYKGVVRLKSGKYRATITKDSTKYELGFYCNEIDAAMAYDNKAKELFGEFACTNF